MNSDKKIDLEALKGLEIFYGRWSEALYSAPEVRRLFISQAEKLAETTAEVKRLTDELANDRFELGKYLAILGKKLVDAEEHANRLAATIDYMGDALNSSLGDTALEDHRKWKENNDK